MNVIIPCKSEAICGLFLKKLIIKKGRCERKSTKGDCLVQITFLKVTALSIKEKEGVYTKGDAVVHEQRNKR